MGGLGRCVGGISLGILLLRRLLPPEHFTFVLHRSLLLSLSNSLILPTVCDASYTSPLRGPCAGRAPIRRLSRLYHAPFWLCTNSH